MTATARRIAVLAALGRNPVSGKARPNRDDLLALELARQLGGDLTLIHAGNPDEAALGDYFAYGASSLDLVPLADGGDVASALVTRLAGYDLILAGSRAEGGEGSGLVPYLVAETLGLPIVADVIAITLGDEATEVTQALAKGQRRRVRVTLPAVIAVYPKALVTPRYAYARRLAGRVTTYVAPAMEPVASPWHREAAKKRPVKFRAAETKSGHARMLSAIVAEARGGAVIAAGTPADKAQAILAYLRLHKLIDW
ncbi:MAG: electron transfer flavodomain protein [Devosia sp.]|nr:electron transfer flavodomain protein [Devosia sp.]